MVQMMIAMLQAQMAQKILLSAYHVMALTQIYARKGQPLALQVQ
jgi:hypothetical protein